MPFGDSRRAHTVHQPDRLSPSSAERGWVLFVAHYQVVINVTERLPLLGRHGPSAGKDYQVWIIVVLQVTYARSPSSLKDTYA